MFIWLRNMTRASTVPKNCEFVRVRTISTSPYPYKNRPPYWYEGQNRTKVDALILIETLLESQILPLCSPPSDSLPPSWPSALWCYINSRWKLQMNTLAILDWFGCIRRRPHKTSNIIYPHAHKGQYFPQWFGERQTLCRDKQVKSIHIDWMAFVMYEFNSFPWKLFRESNGKSGVSWCDLHTSWNVTFMSQMEWVNN